MLMVGVCLGVRVHWFALIEQKFMSEYKGRRVHWFALIEQKFMSEYKGRSRFVLGNI